MFSLVFYRVFEETIEKTLVFICLLKKQLKKTLVFKGFLSPEISTNKSPSGNGPEMVRKWFPDKK